MTFRDCNPIFTVRDLAASVAFYRDIIGFEVYFDTDDVVGLVAGAVLLMLIRQDSGNVRQPAGSGNVVLLADEVESIYRRCLDGAAAVLVDVGDRPYGQRDFAVADPDGNVLTIACALR